MMGNELNEGERLVKVETQLENVLKEMVTLSKAFTRLEEKLDKREESFVTKEVLDEKLRLRDVAIEGIQKGLNEVRANEQAKENTKKQILPTWAGNLLNLGAVLIALLAYLKGGK
jgi:hypothetical protein